MSYSQIGQDIFVTRVLQEKRNGLFFDIGGGYPIHINNTYLLEKEYGWTGISIDLEATYAADWASSRTSRFLVQNALTTDYFSLMGELVKSQDDRRIDYLSVDLEPPINTLLALKQVPLKDFRFSVITFEHDMYRSDPGHTYDSLYTLRESRQLLTENGYKLVFANMQEDWWIDGELFDEESSYININEVPKNVNYV